MAAFKIIEGEYVIIKSGGVYKHVAMAERNGYLFAVASGGYVQLKHDGTTSKDKLHFDEISFEGPLARTKTGKLCRPSVDDSVALDKPTQQLLLGVAE